MTKFVVSDALDAPEVQVLSITSLSSRITWNEINYPVEEWLVMLTKNDGNDADRQVQ